MDRDWFIGGTSLCDGWSYSLQSGKFTNCTGFYPYGPRINTGSNVTMLVDRNYGDIYYYVNGTSVSSRPVYSNSNLRMGDLYFAVTLRNIGDEVRIVN